MNKFFHSSKKIFILLALFFLFTRFYNLTLLPIFTDESIYIYWAKHIATYNSNLFMSLTDGKPPLLIWIIAILLKIFPSDMYLFAGRFISVIAGAITLIGVYKLSYLLFNSKKTAFVASFLYIISPFMLFYDRLALYDSFLCAMLIWSVYYALKTSIFHQKKDALLWGLFLGLGFLTKPPAIIFLLLTPVCYFLLKNKNDIKKNLKKVIFLPLIALVVSELINNTQRLSVNYQLANIKNQHFQLSLNEFLANPFTLLGSNLKEVFDWIIAYYTFPIFLLGCFTLIILLFKDFRKGLILSLLWIVPIIIFATFGKIIFPRYILFSTPYFLIGLSAIIVKFFSYKYSIFLKIAAVVILVSLSLRFDYYLLSNPTRAPFARTEYHQYISDKPAGYGLNAIFTFLDKELSQGPQITLVTQGKFGLFPYAFKLKYWDDKRITIFPNWISKNIETDLYELQKSTKVYVALWENETIPASLPLRLVMKAEKPGGENSILLAVPK